MAFADDVRQHADQIRSRLPHIRGEESTKHSLVIPFLHLLGWDPFDPREVMPEYVADFAIKRGGQLEKVDYAICQGGAPAVFVECKAHDEKLEDYTGQLAKYFNATPSVKVAALTNGVRVKLFTDLQKPNIMDSAPWIDIDLLSPAQIDLGALQRLRKTDFSADEITNFAERAVYFRKMSDYMASALREPGEAFVRFVAGAVFPDVRLMPKVVERLTPILKDAIQQAVLDSVAKSFASPPPVTQIEPELPRTEDATSAEKERAVETTPEETRCYEMIAQFVKEVHPEAVVAPRDSQTYFAVNQGSMRKWFIRFNVQRPPYWIAFRHVTPEELRVLVPGCETLTASFADSRISLSCVDDVAKSRAAIVAAYDREASRRSDDSDGGNFSVCP